VATEQKKGLGSENLQYFVKTKLYFTANPGPGIPGFSLGRTSEEEGG
jgi:hypothetical protein